MKKSLISVIMPAYNHEKYIGEAIESVLKQSFTNYEFIIINDGSTDRTADVIKNYNDSRIKYYEQINADAYNTINRGLMLAKGDYVAIINSDDIYHDKRLELLTDVAEQTDACFIITNICPIDESSSIITDSIHPWITWYEKLLGIYNTTNSLEKTFYEGNIAATTSNLFFSRTLIDEIGTFKPYRYAHDYDYILRALQRYPRHFNFIVDKKYLKYRLHATNTINEAPAKANKEVLTILLDNLLQITETEHNIDNIKSIVYAITNNRNAIEYIYNVILQDKEAVIQEKSIAIESLESKIHNTFNSISWRSTAFFRWLFDKVRNTNHLSL